MSRIGVFFVHFNGAAWFVKEGEFFESQGGLTEDWGKAWHAIGAYNTDDARARAVALFGKRGERLPQPIKLDDGASWADLELLALRCPIIHATMTAGRVQGWTRERIAIAIAVHLSKRNKELVQADIDRLMNSK